MEWPKNTMDQPTNQSFNVSNACFTLDDHKSFDGDKSTYNCSVNLDDIQSVLNSSLDIITEQEYVMIAKNTIERKSASAARDLLQKITRQINEIKDKINTLIVKIDEEIKENKFICDEMNRREFYREPTKMWQMEINQSSTDLERLKKEMETETEYSSEKIKIDYLEKCNDRVLERVKNYQSYVTEVYKEKTEAFMEIYKNNGIFASGTLIKMKKNILNMNNKEDKLFKEIEEFSAEHNHNMTRILESENGD